MGDLERQVADEKARYEWFCETIDKMVAEMTPDEYAFVKRAETKRRLQKKHAAYMVMRKRCKNQGDALAGVILKNTPSICEGTSVPKRHYPAPDPISE